MLVRFTQLFFAFTMIAMGVIGIATGTFAAIWAGVPHTLPDRQLLAYLCVFVSLGCGIAMLWKQRLAPAALALFIYLAVWTLLFKLPFIIRAPLVEVSYQSAGENLVLVAAALVIYAMAAKRGNVLSGRRGLRIAHVLYGLALVAFGFSHFAYLNLTAPLVPAWLPKPVFWAYLTGVLYLLSGAALISGIAAGVGALLAAVQIALITILVWGPVVLRGQMSPMDFQETVVSWALTAGALVIAASVDAVGWRGRSEKRTEATPRRSAAETT